MITAILRAEILVLRVEMPELVLEDKIAVILTTAAEMTMEIAGPTTAVGTTEAETAPREGTAAQRRRL